MTGSLLTNRQRDEVMKLTCLEQQDLPPIYVWSEGTTITGPLGSEFPVTTLQVFQPLSGQCPPEVTPTFKQDFKSKSMTAFHYYDGHWYDYTAPTAARVGAIKKMTTTIGRQREALGGPVEVPLVLGW